MANTQQHIKPLVVVQDKDPSDVNSNQGECLYRFNVYSGNRNRGVIIPEPGAQPVVFNLPAGDNEVVGAHHDVNLDQVFYCVWNSNREHKVLRFFPGEKRIEEIATTPWFDFSRYRPVVMRVVENRFVVFTDKYQPQRMLDLEKLLYKDVLCWDMFSDHSEGTTMQGFDANNNQLFSININYTLIPGLEDWDVVEFSINNSPAAAYIDIEVCNTYAEIKSTDPALRRLVVSTPNGRATVIPNNFLPDQLEEQEIDFVKWPPHLKPEVSLVGDVDFKGENLIDRRAFQFRIKYVYDDFQGSAWGPWSDVITLDLALSAGNPNAIDVDFSELNTLGASPFDRLNFQSNLKYVEVGVREADIGDGVPGQLRLVKRLDRDEWALDKVYRFYNNEATVELSNIEDNKISTAVPLLSGTVDEANGVVVFGDNIEGYDAPCVEANLTVDYNDESDQLWDVEGRVRIVAWDGTGWLYDVNFGTVDDAGFPGTTWSNPYNLELTDGFTVYLAGTNYYAMTDSDGNFKISGVPPGTYLVRIASHHCTFGDVHGLGDHYVAGGNSLLYQKTSTFTVTVNSAMPANPTDQKLYTRESKIVLAAGGGVLTLADSHVNAIEVAQNVAVPPTPTPVFGYLVDEEWDTMELLLNAALGLTDHYADHNGFVWDNPGNSAWQHVTAKSAGGGFTGSVSFTWEYGTRQNVEDQNPLSTYTTGSKEEAVYHSANLVAPGVTDINLIRTKILSKILDTDGRPVKNATMVFERGQFAVSDEDGILELKVYGDPADTTVDPATNRNRREGDLIWGTQTLNFKILDFVNPQVQSILLEPFGQDDPADYNDISVFFNATEQQVPVNALFEPWKNGGEWLIGIGHSDRANRSSVAVWSESTRLKLPFITEQMNDYFPGIGSISGKAPGEFRVTLNIESKPPIWADHAYVMVTKNLRQVDYLSFIAADIRYGDNIEEDPTTGEEIISDTTFVGGELMYIDMGNALKMYQDYNADSQLAWGVVEGDRIRIIRRADGAIADFFDVPVKGTFGNYVVIENFDNSQEYLAGSQWEIYRPGQLTENRPMYEIASIDIINPYSASRRYDLTSITLRGDAYRNRRLMFTEEHDNLGARQAIIRTHESSSISDFYRSRSAGHGRIAIGGEAGDDENIGQTDRFSSLRWGGAFIDGTKRNRLSDFDAGDIQENGREFGPISATSIFDNVMLVVQETNTSTRLINKSIAYQGEQEIEIRSDNFLDKPQYLAGGYGCKDKASFAVSGNTAIWFDINKGCVAAYARQAGVRNISGYDDRYDSSKYNEQYFLEKRRQYNIGGDEVQLIRSISGVYVHAKNEYIISFNELSIDTSVQYFGQGFGANIGDHDLQFPGNHNIIPSLNGTVILADPSFGYVKTDQYQGWHGFYPFNPKVMVSWENNWASFMDGVMYTHDDEANPGVFYGVAYDHKIWIVFNENIREQKHLQNIKAESSGPWYIDPSEPAYVPLHEDEDPVSRQETYLTKDNLQRMDRSFFGSFWMNINTPNVNDPLFNGEPIRGELVVLKMKCDNGEFSWLRGFTVTGRNAPRT